jgi:hypothetical protein
MAEPRDHVPEQQRGADPVRPREPDHPAQVPARLADLQARLERLPAGHPSSPYRDDGSRKPPPPDLAEHELPLPDERPADTGRRDQDLAAGDRARIGTDGSWDWKGHHLSPEQSRIADEALARCRGAEGRDAEGNYGDHGLTPAMRRIEAQLDHGHLAEDTEAHALKDPDRFKEKLAQLIKDEPDKSAQQHADEIHDGIRYTFILDADDYASSVEHAIGILEEHGFELGVIKNNWGNDEYKGLHTRWTDNASGRRFEVQFHTDASWQAKEWTHGAYGRINDLTTPTAEREGLRAYQRDVSGRVAKPTGWEEVADYRKEGW